MILELHVLGWSVLLAAAQLILAVGPVNRQLGVEWTAGPRDEPRALSGLAGRLKRAFDNQVEGLVFFTGAAVVVALGDASSPVTQGCALVYLAARILYLPAYAWGWSPWRSVIWAAGFFATLLMLLAALLF